MDANQLPSMASCEQRAIAGGKGFFHLVFCGTPIPGVAGKAGAQTVPSCSVRGTLHESHALS